MFSFFSRRPNRSTRKHAVKAKSPRWLSRFEMLEDRSVPSVSILNNSGNGYSALSFNTSGGYVPPDTCGAAGPSNFVETVNQAVAIYGPKGTGASAVTDTLSHFLFTTGKLTRADSGSGLSDPITTYDEKIQRFIIGDQDVNFSTHVSAFDLAVSKTNNPTTLTAADWNFYKITTTQTGEDADYPGNFGYNADAFVFTLNMFAVAGTSGTNHVQVVSVNTNDLANGVASPAVFANNLADFSVRPTTMHDSLPGDPMWLVTEHGDNLSLDVYKMTGELTTSATFTRTNLAVTAYSQAVAPKNPNGSSITTNIDSRIMKAAEANNTIVTAHTVSVSSTQDVAQWYAIDVSTGTPKLSQQGRISAGNNTYIDYPGIDINAAGSIGMSYIKSGTDTTTDYMSMWVTGRVASDAPGTMETPVIVPNGTGQANYTDFANPHRQGDLSGINVDPVDGTFWAVNEFANTQATANWGTAVANFSPSLPANSADLSVTMSGPTSITAGTNATYTITLSNLGPNPATGVVLADSLPAGSVLMSMTQTSGTDAFTLTSGSGTATETASASIASGSSDTFTLVVSTPSSLTAGSNFSNSATASSTTTDSNTANNTASVNGAIVGPSADLSVTQSGPATVAEGNSAVYTITVTNNDTINSGTAVVLTDTLGANLTYQSATTSQGTVSQSGSTITVSIGTLAPGASVTITVTALANEDGATSNTATVSASSSDPNTGNNTAAVSTTISEPAIVVSGSPLTFSGKSASNVTTATFTHANGIEPASAFTATINWGDGRTSTGTITLSGTTYTVKGSHNYRRNGTYTVTTTVKEIGQAAELLLGKVGDEVPDLPEHYTPADNSDHRTLNGQTNDFAHMVTLYLNPTGSGPSSNASPSNNGNSVTITLDDLRKSLISLINRGMNEQAHLPQISHIVDTLRKQADTNARALDVLFMIDDVLGNL